MDPHWEALCAAGLPDGAGRLLPSPSLARAREAVRALGLSPESIAGWQREPLLSWLRAFAHEYPSRFASELGRDGELLAEWLEREPLDINRYLKLRRIAAENLSRFL